LFSFFSFFFFFLSFHSCSEIQVTSCRHHCLQSRRCLVVVVVAAVLTLGTLQEGKEELNSQIPAEKSGKSNCHSYFTPSSLPSLSPPPVSCLLPPASSLAGTCIILITLEKGKPRGSF